MNNPQLDRYLFLFDKALSSISISEKAEIITEIKSHILASLEKYPDQKIDSILHSLGEPEQVASRYLLERGLKPQRAPFHPILKWLVIGFLGTSILILILGMLLFWRLTPVFTLNNNVGNLEMLHGAIKIHFNTENEDETSIRYIPNLSKQILNLATANLSCGSYRITTKSTPVEINKNCTVVESHNEQDYSGNEQELKINTSNGYFVKCRFYNNQLLKCNK